MDSWGRVGTSLVIEISFVPDRAGIKKWSIFFHFVSFRYPLYINTIWALEKTKKSPEIFRVRPVPPSCYYSWIALNFPISHEIASQDFHPTLASQDRAPCWHRFCRTRWAQRSSLHLLCCGDCAALPLCLQCRGEPGHCCCCCLEQVLPSRRVLWSCSSMWCKVLPLGVFLECWHAVCVMPTLTNSANPREMSTSSV